MSAAAGFKLLSYRGEAGEARAGVLSAERVHDVAAITGVARWATVLGVLESWADAQGAIVRALGAASTASRPLATTTLLAPILYPGQIFCAGANYRDHVDEMARAFNLKPEPDPHELGLNPWHFIKTARSSVVGPNATVHLPAHSKMVDWEAELAVVIGRPARNVTIARALEHVAGYTIANDLSARDHLKRPHVADTSPFKYDWISQKCWEGACPLGPWITPAADIPDPQRLAVKLWVNDELMQDSNTAQMILNITEQIAHLSTRVTLHPGDVILTGTPAGVGLPRGRFLKPGDTVRIEIEGVGTLVNTFAE